MAVGPDFEAQDLRQPTHHRGGARSHLRNLLCHVLCDAGKAVLARAPEAQRKQFPVGTSDGAGHQSHQQSVLALVLAQQHRQQAGADRHVRYTARGVRALEPAHGLGIEVEDDFVVDACPGRRAPVVGYHERLGQILIDLGQPIQLVRTFARCTEQRRLRDIAAERSHGLGTAGWQGRWRACRIACGAAASVWRFAVNDDAADRRSPRVHMYHSF